MSSPDLAILGIQVESRGDVEAAKNLNKMSDAADRAEKSTSGMSKSAKRSFQQVGSSSQIMTKEMTASAAAMMKTGRASRQFNLRGISLQLSQVAQQATVTGRPLHALAIQLPDLAMYLGGPLAIAGGVAAGALLSMVSTMGYAKSASEQLRDQLGELAEAVRAYKNATDTASQSAAEMAREFGGVSVHLTDALQGLADIERLKAHETLDKTAKSLHDLVLETSWYSDRGPRALAQDFLHLGNMSQQARIEGQKFVDLMDQFATSPALNAQLAAAVKLREMLMAASGGVEHMTEEQLKFYELLEKSIVQAHLLGGRVQDVASQTSQLAKTQAAMAQYVRTRNMAAEDEVAKARELIDGYNRQAELSRAIALYGADSAQVARIRYDREMSTKRAMVEQWGISRHLKDEVYASAEGAYQAQMAAQGLAGQLASAAAQAAALAANLGAAAVGAEQQAAVGLARVRAQIDAIKSGQDEALAGSMAALSVERSRYVAAQRAAGMSRREAELAAQMNFRNRTEYIQQTGELTRVRKAHQEAARAATRGARASVGGANAARKALADLRKEAERWKDRVATPVQKYREELGKLNEILSAGLIGQDTYGLAVEKLNEELSNSLPLVGDVSDAFGQWVSRGFRDFKGFVTSVWRSFQSLLAKMVSTAARNAIMFNFGMSGGGGAAGAAQQAAGGGIGGWLQGAMGKALGSWGGATGLLGGLSGTVSGFMSGGFAGAFKGMSTAFATGPLAAIGSVIPVLGLVGAAFSFFRTKTKLLDAGLRITANNTDTLVESFEKLHKSRFWGLSKWTENNYKAADGSVADPIKKAISDIQGEALRMGEALGLTAANFASFRSSVKISLKDMNASQQQAEIKRALGIVAEDFSIAALGWFNDEIPGLVREGENFRGTFEALYTAIGMANGALSGLGFTLFDQSVKGAKAARDWADGFGGLEAMQQKTQSFYANFYSSAQQQFDLTNKLTSAMANMGYALPSTVTGFRELVASIQKTGNMDHVAKLINMADTFNNLQAMISQTRASYDLLVGDEHKLMRATQDLRTQLSEMGLALPQSTEGFRALIDRARVAGDELAALKLTGMATAFTDLQAMIDQSQADYDLLLSNEEKRARTTHDLAVKLGKLGLVLPRTAAGFRALIDAARAAGDEMTALRLTGMSRDFMSTIGKPGSADTLSTATKDLKAAFRAEMDRVRKIFGDRIAYLQKSLTDRRAKLRDAQQIADSLEGALHKRIFPDAEGQRMAQDRASDYLRQIVMQGRVDDGNKLSDALGILERPSMDTYKTLEEYRRDFDKNTGLIAQIKRISDVGLTAEEQAVRLLQQQLDFAKSEKTQMLELLQGQLDGMLGLKTAILSLKDAISNFKVAQAATASVSGKVTSSGVEALYKSVLGRDADAAGKAFYMKSKSLSDVHKALAGSTEAKLRATYKAVLGREADTAGLQFWKSHVEAGRVKLSDAIKSISTSKEAQAYRAPVKTPAVGAVSGDAALAVLSKVENRLAAIEAHSRQTNANTRQQAYLAEAALNQEAS